MTTEEKKPVVPNPEPKEKPKGPGNPATKPKTEAAPKPVNTPIEPSSGAIAKSARLRRRHWNVILSFLLLVVLPVVVSVWYLWQRAADQYVSDVSFSVRSSAPVSGGSDLLTQLNQLSGTNSTDTDILYQFIKSQDMVKRINKRLNLKKIYSRHYEKDPVFSLSPEAEIEDLVIYWKRMVRIGYDRPTGLMSLQVFAFDPKEAQTIAKVISEESSIRVNELSDIARDDATRHAREGIDRTFKDLRDKREAITLFRLRHQIIDPSANIQGQMGLLNTLNEQLATAIIELRLLMDGTDRATDPRVKQMELRIKVIRDQIQQELSLFGESVDGAGSTDYANLVSEFEGLSADREFAEQLYRSALLSYNATQAEASRHSRYLAEHIKPSIASSSRYPQRILIIVGLSLVLLLFWGVSILIYYSIRDRR